MRLGVVFGALLCPVEATAAEAPFAPLPNVPDYRATFVVRPHGPGSRRVDGKTVTHHGGWSRIDSVADDRYRPTDYVTRSGPVSITVYREPSGVYRSLQIRRGLEAHRSVGWNDESFRTDERKTFAGESCQVWNVARIHLHGRGNSRPQLSRLSCISHDGIELWDQFVSEQRLRAFAEATTLQRGPVLPSEVLPPADLFDLESWLSPEKPISASPDVPGDVTVILEPLKAETSDSRPVRRTVRRHYPWTYTEELLGDGSRKLRLDNEIAGLNIQFESDPAGEFTQLSIRRVPASESQGTVKGGPRELGRKEMILDEECTWFDMWPGMADGGLRKCRTQDGVVLKEQEYRRGGLQPELQAVRLQRAPVERAMAMPPPDILIRRNWGIPE